MLHFLLGDDAFGLMPWIVKPYSQRQLAREERIVKLQDLQRKEGGEKRLWNLSEPLRVLLSTMEQRPRVVSDIEFMCVVLHNILRTHQDRAERAPNPGNHVVSQ